jgi:glucose 1-dehydrogenase
MSDNHGRLVLVTGAAGGIGLACAQRFFNDGERIALCDIDAAGVAEQAAALDPAGTRVRAFAFDVSSAAEVARGLAEVRAWGGPVEVLLNVAGIVHKTPFLDLTEAEFDRVLAVNLKSVFLLSQAVARDMVAAGVQGTIVNMSSVNAVLVIDQQLAYSVSKGGINQMTRSMALALAPHGIRVNAIGPGTIGTELARKAVLASDEARRQVMSRTPMGRIGETSEVAGVAAFLAGPDASYMTGQIVYPDGGRMMLNYTVPVED